MPTYPERYLSDPRITGLSNDAELILRRFVDALWLTENGHIKFENHAFLHRIVGRGLKIGAFKKCFNELMGSGLIEMDNDGLLSSWHYNDHRKLKRTSAKRAEAGRKGGARPKKRPDPPPAKKPANYEPGAYNPGRRSGPPPDDMFARIKKMNSE